MFLYTYPCTLISQCAANWEKLAFNDHIKKLYVARSVKITQHVLLTNIYMMKHLSYSKPGNIMPNNQNE